ncbi:hypothetical protein CYY_007783 [Polysphondylium violaceum]|uniref:Thioredoxin domain-containing protein n=1 Tax=Polysphondylium violaceum TaxID=133409 RepID=A0A8J4PN04_9MYCE|nr:hypothetical protein CYY_007783 [Polysphondylium violaceum]
MPLIIITSASQFDQELTGEKVLIYFTAQWCRAIGPKVEQLANKYPDVHILKVDIDTLNGHPLVQTVSSVPHFVARKNGALIHEFSGASEAQLEQVLKQLTN